MESTVYGWYERFIVRGYSAAFPLKEQLDAMNEIYLEFPFDYEREDCILIMRTAFEGLRLVLCDLNK